jgi:hypothetical protein
MSQKLEGSAEVAASSPSQNSNQSGREKRMNYDSITIALRHCAIANGYHGAASDEVKPT